MAQPSLTPWRFAPAVPPHEIDYKEYRDRVIHETNKITAFLDDRGGELFIISAPKGYGKTLLLLAKRKQLEELGGYRFSPNKEMVEQPDGKFPALAGDQLNEYRADYSFWITTWSICIKIAALKMDMRTRQSHAAEYEGLNSSIRVQVDKLDDWTKSVLFDPHTRNSPTDIFTTFFAESYRSRVKILASMNTLDILCGTIQSQIAFFIDNVDEYFQEQEAPPEKRALMERVDPELRARRNDIWTAAQLALVGAAFKLHKANSHIKVFCTVRQEAFAKLSICGPDSSQIKGFCIEIDYDRDDLQQIFLKNIRLMKEKFLVDTGSADLMGRFFGSFYQDMRHKFVSQTESAFDFLLRHSFYRPRDLMIFGRELADIDPPLRSPIRLKKAVSLKCDDLVSYLFTEMEPFFCLPDRDLLLPIIKKNVMTADEINEVTADYLKSLPSTASGEELHPFAVLSSIGMLGNIRTENDGERVSKQRFVTPAQVTLNHGVTLPRTDGYYLIHPALDHKISEKAGEEYDQQFHTSNIVGNQCIWKEPASSYFVVKGDISGFSRIMENELYKAIVESLYRWVEAKCGELEFCEISGGDSVLLIDKSAEKIADAVTALLKMAHENANIPMTFRFGGSAGPIQFLPFTRRVKGIWQSLTFPIGLALRTSARLEPHADKGALIVDHEFARLGNTRNLEFREISNDELRSLDYDHEAQRFIVQKHKDDPPHPTRIYAVKLRE